MNCPRCGSTNIQFNRENQGEVRGKKSKQVIHVTVGFCKDCGATWYPNNGTQKKTDYTWLWILGWICMFPIPLTILLVRNKNMDNKLKYGLIAGVWILFFLMGSVSSCTKKTQQPVETVSTGTESSTTVVVENSTSVSEAETVTETNAQSASIKENIEEELFVILKAGEENAYSEARTLNKGTEFEETQYVYYLPVGTYQFKNISKHRGQVNVYSRETHRTEEGWEEPVDSFFSESVEPDKTVRITIEKDQYIEIQEPDVYEVRIDNKSDISNNNDENNLSETASSKLSEAPSQEMPKTESVTASPTVPATQAVPNVSLGEQNALKKALSYLRFTAFSYNGLIDQLKYEGFTQSEATYGADNCGADWNAQATSKAQNYLRTSAFSYKGIIEQLEYDGFTHEQAVYGADTCGADWNVQAAAKAKSYLSFTSFSRDDLIGQLVFEGFTQEQAEYGASAVGY